MSNTIPANSDVILFSKMLAAGKASRSEEHANALAPGESGINTSPLGEIYQGLTRALSGFKDEDLTVFSGSLNTHNALYKEVSVTAYANGPSESSSTGNGPTFKLKKSLLDALRKLRNECGSKPKVKDGKDRKDGETGSESYVLADFPMDGYESAVELCKKLGIAAPDGKSIFSISSGGEQRWVVTPDLAPLDNMIASMEDKMDRELTMAEYNSWKSGFDIQIAHLEDAMKKQAQKYANAYNQFEHFYKTISSIIESLARSLRGYLQF